MTLSLNEVDALAKKATRGAGYPWGHAEEAGKAVRWLCQNGVDGCAILARTLAHFDGRDGASGTPDVTQTPWQSPGDTLCPIIAGTALSDMAPALRDGAIRVNAVVEPALLLPFAAAAALMLDHPVRVECNGATATTDGKRLAQDGAFDAAGPVSVFLAEAIDQPAPQQTRASPDPATFAALNRFAHRTYAPATEASRLKGAGAGTNDND